MIISRKKMANAKVNKIKNGYSAFAETKEVIDYIKKELENQKIPVHIDETEQGCWFIPMIKNEK